VGLLYEGHGIAGRERTLGHRRRSKQYHLGQGIGAHAIRRAYADTAWIQME
jgi:hypothetical protein